MYHHSEWHYQQAVFCEWAPSPFTQVRLLHVQCISYFLEWDLWVHFFRTDYTCGIYPRVASINTSKLQIAIIINNGSLFHTTNLTGGHVDHMHYNSLVRALSR